MAGPVCDPAHYPASRQYHQRAVDLLGHHRLAVAPAGLGNGDAGLGGRHRFARAGQHLDELVS
ncbi:hypothetical protein BI294_10880 [Mycobacterium avium subsp. hominissuis]|nr:hypothetical protein BI294_10880 [Mycobacterium avium subsp. hominissuis]